MKLLSEPFIQKATRKYLSKQGFGPKNVAITDLREKGVDIKVKKLRPKPIGWYYLVECKGDPKEGVKSMGGSRSSSLNSALGQIISRMHTNRKSLYGGYNYGIALPISFEKQALEKIPYYVGNRLRLSIFIVNCKGEVKKYNHRNLKIIQKNKSKKIYDELNKKLFSQRGYKQQKVDKETLKKLKKLQLKSGWIEDTDVIKRKSPDKLSAIENDEDHLDVLGKVLQKHIREQEQEKKAK